MLALLTWLAITTPLFLHVVMATREDGESVGLTCFTCSEVTSNFLCNKYAVDRPCPTGRVFCRTKHDMDFEGFTVKVTKQCASRDECSADTVGCDSTNNRDGGQVCVSCCDTSYCNEVAPTNTTTAVYMQTKGGSERLQCGIQSTALWITLVILAITWT